MTALPCATGSPEPESGDHFLPNSLLLRSDAGLASPDAPGASAPTAAPGFTDSPTPAPSTATSLTLIPDSSVSVWCGDARTILPLLPSESVNCVVTSPPYYGLRDYGTGAWEGGATDCDHSSARRKTRYDYSLASSPIQQKRGAGTDARPAMFREVCPTCGARRVDDQLGLESSPHAYVVEMADVFDEVKRVLHPSGVMFLNIGDCWREKQLQGIPWRLALELQERGWCLRSEIIWNKSNPMPESAKDRPTYAHEQVFLLTREASYFWDYDAVKEPAAWNRWGDQNAGKYDGFDGKASLVQAKTKEELQQNEWRNIRSVWEIPTESNEYAHFATMPEKLAEKCIQAGCPVGGVVLDPFAGSGTTLVVADDLERRSIGIELSVENAKMIEHRIAAWSKKRSGRRQLTLEEM